MVVVSTTLHPTQHNFTRDKQRGRTPTLFKTHKPSAKCYARPMAVRIPGHLRWPALLVCDVVTCPSGESLTGEQIRKRGGGSSADQVQTKKAAVTPVYSPALCIDGVAATARLSLKDLGDRVPPRPAIQELCRNEAMRLRRVPEFQ